VPNYCDNDLTICGPKARVTECLALIGADRTPPRFDFNMVIPYPEEFRFKDEEHKTLGYEGFREKYGYDAKDGFNSGGYEWCVDNWGTKWNAGKVIRLDLPSGQITLTFDTAWSPPTPVVKKLSELFPDLYLRLDYFECLMRFSGGLEIIPTEETREWFSDKYKGSRGG